MGFENVVASDINTANNRFISSVQDPVTYDDAGQMTIDGRFRGMNYQYDANGRQRFAETFAHTTQQTSVYDGMGQRVQTTLNGAVRQMVYDVGGRIVAEYSGGALQRENVYRGGQLLATEEFTTPRTNYALASNGSTATASSNFYNGTSFAPSPAGAIDGEHRGSNYATTGAWHSSTNTMPQWWELNFNTSRTIEEIDVFSCQDNWSNPSEPTESMTFNSLGLTQFQVQYWNGSGWVDVPGGNVTGNNKVWRKFTFAPITTSKLRVYIHASGDNWSRLVELKAWSVTAGNGTSGVRYVMQDIQGSTRAVMDANSIVARHDYLPFGEEIGAGTGMRTAGQQFGAIDQNRMRYAMTERDAATGLDHTWFRKYENTSGRWTTPDPMSGSASDPQTFNRYSYVANDPVNFVDPSGLQMDYLCIEYGMCGGGGGGADQGWNPNGFWGWGNLMDRPRMIGREIIAQAERDQIARMRSEESGWLGLMGGMIGFPLVPQEPAVIEKAFIDAANVSATG